MLFQLWEGTKFVLKFVVALTYGWNHEVVIYFLWIRSLLMKVNDNNYSQYRHHDISCDWDIVSPWVILRTCEHKIYGHNKSLSKILYMLLESQNVFIDHYRLTFFMCILTWWRDLLLLRKFNFWKVRIVTCFCLFLKGK